MHQPVQALRLVSGLPRIPHLKVWPAMELRVTSNPASFGTSGAQSFGLPLGLALPAAPPDPGRELPRILHLRVLPAMELRVASLLASFSASSGETSGCPSASLLSSRLAM
jgi:hypothetical protein